MPMFGEAFYHFLHSVKAGIKDSLSPQLLFTDLGLKYVGPVDGHDERAVEVALRRARGFGRPVIVHVVTRKGMGYPPAENDEAEQMHSTGPLDPATGQVTKVAGPGWTATFADALIGYAKNRRDIVAITAAMPGPTGLTAFGKRFPDRLFDVGIAEQHALTSAAGLAMGGMHPGGGHLLDVPQPGVRPDHDGRGAAQAARHPGTGPGRDHRQRRRQPQRHVGPVDPGDRARHASGRAPRLHPAARGTRRGARRQRRPDGATVPQRRCGRRHSGAGAPGLGRCARGAGRRAEPRRAAGGGRRVRVDGAGGGQAATQPGDRRDGDRPALGVAGLRLGARTRGAAQTARHARGQRGARRRGLSRVGRAARRRDRRALPRRRAAAGVLRPRLAQ